MTIGRRHEFLIIYLLDRLLVTAKTKIAHVDRRVFRVAQNRKKPCFSLPVSKKENPKDKINRVKMVNKQDFSNLRQKAGELQMPQSPFAPSLRNGEC